MTLNSYNAKLSKLVKTVRKNTKSQNLDLDIPSDFIKFNELIGLPQHPKTKQPTPLAPYQFEFIKNIPQDRNKRFHINKSRQIGCTEIILRVVAFFCFSKYKGGKIIIIAGTSERTAADIMRRLKQLFRNISSTVADSRHGLQLRLVNGTEILALPSNSSAIRGLTNVRAIFVDEAAHFNLKDDSVVLNAIEPLVTTNQADLFLVSTPNGRRGFFYDIAISENEYHKIQWDYTVAAGYVYDQATIEQQLQRRDIDVDQEYRCQFTSSRNSVFGSDFTTGNYEAEDYG